MNYPFESYSSIESFYDRIESNPNGHYLFGQSMFWHSGIHIFADSQKEFKPIINGKVVCYRISQNYKQVELPPVLSGEELLGDWSDYKEYYDDKNGRIKNEKSEKKYPVSDCFILLEHTIIIEKKDFTFYTLYMNLAPACENPNYDKSLKTDGSIHGHAINQNDEDFFIDKIGMPAKNKKNIYFDFAILSDKSLKDFSSENGKRLFWAFNKNILLYQREGNNEETPEKVTIPKWAHFNATRFQDGNLVAYEIKITHIHVYLTENNIKDDKLVKLDDICFSKGTQKIYNPSKELEFICSKVQPVLNKLEGTTVVVNKVTDSDSLYIILEFNEPITFWTKQPLKINSESISDNQLIEKYDKNPYLFNYSQVNDISEEIKQDIKDIAETPIQGIDGSNYYKVIFKDSVSDKIYVSEEGKNECFKSATDFDKWFYFYKESDSIICDRTKVVTDTINNHDDIIKKAMLLVPIIGIWWTGILTWELLKYAYGKLSSEKNSQGGELTKPEIRKIVCCHPIEWDKNQFSNLNIKNPNIKKKLVNEATAIDLWNGGLDKIFTKNPYFYHPIYFINHMEKAALFEFNPYEGKKYSEIYKTNSIPKICGDNITETKDSVVESNPGFAPVFKKGNWSATENPDINGYSCVTGFFNQDYLNVKRGNGKTYKEEGYSVFTHEGVDFRGAEGTDIKSFIYGSVLGYGTFCFYGRAVFIANSDSSGIFLLGHLKEYNKKILDSGKVMPGDIIGKVGTSGPSDEKGIDGKYDAHLHITYFQIQSPKYAKTFIKGTNGKSIDAGDSYKYGTVVNPFNYLSKKKANIKPKPVTKNK